MEWSQFVPWSVSIVCMIFAVLTYMRNGSKAKADEKEALTKIIDAMRSELKTDVAGVKESSLKANMKLDQVCATTNETRSDIKVLNNDLREMDKRVVILERDVKTVFHQVDNLREELDNIKTHADN